jgi:hypothetical protein
MISRTLRRAAPHGWVAAGVLIIAVGAPSLWLAAPLPAVTALFGVMLIGTGYAIRSGAAYVVEVDLDELRRSINDDRLWRELATGELPYIGDEPRGRHAS